MQLLICQVSDCDVADRDKLGININLVGNRLLPWDCGPQIGVVTQVERANRCHDSPAASPSSDGLDQFEENRLCLTTTP
jgi:hypothetical protein